MRVSFDNQLSKGKLDHEFIEFQAKMDTFDVRTVAVFGVL